MFRIHTVLLSGGTGTRMGAERPKQFLPLGDRTVLAYSVETFDRAAFNGELCLVAPADYIEETARMLPARSARGGSIQLIAGGADRHASTLAGLDAILAANPDDADLVLFHDVARPLIEDEELRRLVGAFQSDPDLELASLAAPITETIVRAARLPGPLTQTVNREEYFAIKTPQAARVRALRRMRVPNARLQAGYTDLLTWGEAHGIQGWLVPAGPKNLKLTRPADLPYLESLLAQ